MNTYKVQVNIIYSLLSEFHSANSGIIWLRSKFKLSRDSRQYIITSNLLFDIPNCNRHETYLYRHLNRRYQSLSSMHVRSAPAIAALIIPRHISSCIKIWPRNSICFPPITRSLLQDEDEPSKLPKWTMVKGGDDPSQQSPWQMPMMRHTRHCLLVISMMSLPISCSEIRVNHCSQQVHCFHCHAQQIIRSYIHHQEFNVDLHAMPAMASICRITQGSQSEFYVDEETLLCPASTKVLGPTQLF